MAVDREAFAAQNNCTGTVFRFVGILPDGTEKPFTNRFTKALYDNAHITIDQLQGILNRILQHAFVLKCVSVKVFDMDNNIVGEFT